jgi:beta-galactosidase
LAALDLPQDIRLRDNGATRFVFNYGDTIVDISSIIGDAPLYLGEKSLPPCGVAAFAASTT